MSTTLTTHIHPWGIIVGSLLVACDRGCNQTILVPCLLLISLDKNGDMWTQFRRDNITQPNTLNSGAEFDAAPGRFGCQLRWVHFSGPPRFGPLMTFFGFFLLNLGSTAPNYSRRPLMRSSKAPPNQKNRGQFLPQPTRTHRSWHPNLPGAASEPHRTPRRS